MNVSKYFVSGLFALTLLISGAAIGADKVDKAAKEKKEEAPAAEAGKDDSGTAAKKPPKGEILYQAEFEEEDDTDAWSSDNGEIEWQKGGANGSKGCLKIFNPGENTYVVGEKYIAWYDAKTFIDFDYNITGFNEEFYAMAMAAKAGQNVRVNVKGFVKGKWGHAQLKASNLAWQGKSGKGDTFRNFLIVAGGVSKDEKDPCMLIDNVVLTATDKKKEEAAE